MTRIVLLESEGLEVHRLRSDSRRAGLSVIYECARKLAEFERLLSRSPAVVIADVNGAAELPLERLLQVTERAAVTVILLGGDRKEERTTLLETRGRYAASLRRSRLAWLPVVLERTLREQQAMSVAGIIGELQAAIPAGQLDGVSEQLRRVQKLALMGQLSGSIAHEINNPLEAITNLAYLVNTDERLAEELRGYMSMAEQELARVGQITKRALSFHRETQNPEPVLASELLEEVLTLYARKLAEKQIGIERRYESEESLLVFPGEMRQVYANLIANAVDATETGGRIVVRVHTTRQWRPGQKDPIEGVRVTIADSGAGIPLEVRAKLGQPFYTTKGQKGTGLGLWVSQGIVKRYQGRMQLRSSTAPEAHGTTFSIFLPRVMRPRVVEINSAPKAGIATASSHAGLRLRANSK